MFPLYEACTNHRLILVSHTGFVISSPWLRIADPEKIENIISRFPELLFESTPFGGWHNWDEVEKHFMGKPRYIENSFSLEEMPHSKAKKMISAHKPGYLFFGTDSPWTDQKQAVKLLKSLDLDPKLEEDIFYNNAAKLLGISARE